MTEYLLWRHALEDGETTTIYAVRHPSRDTRVRVHFFARPRRLDVWCRSAGVEEAVVGRSGRSGSTGARCATSRPPRATRRGAPAW